MFVNVIYTWSGSHDRGMVYYITFLLTLYYASKALCYDLVNTACYISFHKGRGGIFLKKLLSNYCQIILNVIPTGCFFKLLSNYCTIILNVIYTGSGSHDRGMVYTT